MYPLGHGSVIAAPDGTGQDVSVGAVGPFLVSAEKPPRRGRAALSQGPVASGLFPAVSGPHCRLLDAALGAHLLVQRDVASLDARNEAGAGDTDQVGCGQGAER